MNQTHDLCLKRRAPLSRRSATGLWLMGLSWALWVPLPILPFVGLPTSTRAVGVIALVIISQFAFWAGAFLAGPDAWQRIRALRSRWKRPGTQHRKNVTGPAIDL